MKRVSRVLVPLAAGALLLTACDDDPAAETTDTIEIVGTDEMRFEPDEFVVAAGEEVTVELTSESLEHDFNIEDVADIGRAGETDDDMGADDDHPDVPHDDLHIVHVDPGETDTGSFTIDEPGTYTVYCAVPGHREAGQEATLEVVDAG